MTLKYTAEGLAQALVELRAIFDLVRVVEPVRASVQHLPSLLPPARIRTLMITGAVGAVSGVWLTLTLAEAPDPWQKQHSSA